MVINWTAIGILVSLIGLLILVHHFERNKRDERVNTFIANFFNNYKNDGLVLEHLIPSGIANLKNDREIQIALEHLRHRLRFHPLRTWKDDIRKIGYKKFFQRVTNGPGPLNKNAIGIYINAWKDN
jgi:hypothetical protein